MEDAIADDAGAEDGERLDRWPPGAVLRCEPPGPGLLTDLLRSLGDL